ncbi:response regulator [Nitrospira sp. T9]|uniref:response regulator n=1 Tax=unclassified Nitrospira TaxID=2652172 RepID=UPI003F9CB0C3
MIMIVTFHEEIRGKISAFLSEKGYEVCVPPHRQDVVSLVKEKSPLVVVLDMYVAAPNGLDVLKELRAQNYHGGIVALAGTSVRSLMSQASQLGVNQVIGGFQGDGGALNLDQVESAIKMALHSTIAKRAFELYVARGRTKGKDLEDWLEAERQIFKKTLPLSSGESKQRAKTEGGSQKPKKTQKKST